MRKYHTKSSEVKQASVKDLFKPMAEIPAGEMRIQSYGAREEDTICNFGPQEEELKGSKTKIYQKIINPKKRKWLPEGEDLCQPPHEKLFRESSLADQLQFKSTRI